MLMPKKVKYRKQQRGRMRGKAWRGSSLAFGDYGLKTLDAAWITDRQIEAGRIAIARFVKRGGKIWIRVFPDKPVTKKPAETRMGKGKGAPEYWVAVVKPGRILHLIEDPAWFDYSNPVFGRPFPFTHSRFCRLLRDGFIGKNANPNLSAALDEASDGDSSGFNLAVCDPSRIQCFQAVIPERQRRSAPGLAAHSAALLLAVLHFFGHQHRLDPCGGRSLRRFAGEDLAFVNPAFHPDDSVSRICLRKTVIHIGPQCV